MTRHLGSLGRQREPLDIAFDYFGETIRVHPRASDTVEMEFIEAGQDIDLDQFEGVDLANVDAAGLDAERTERLAREVSKAARRGWEALLACLQQVIHPDDWPAYRRLARENGQQFTDLMADLRKITAAVVEADTGFPTTPPSGSPGGLAATLVKSEGGSSSPADSSDTDRALVLRRGRPDLQEFFVQAEEEQQRAAALAGVG